MDRHQRHIQADGLWPLTYAFTAGDRFDVQQRPPAGQDLHRDVNRLGPKRQGQGKARQPSATRPYQQALRAVFSCRWLRPSIRVSAARWIGSSPPMKSGPHSCSRWRGQASQVKRAGAATRHFAAPRPLRTAISLGRQASLLGKTDRLKEHPVLFLPLHPVQIDVVCLAPGLPFRQTFEG